MKLVITVLRVQKTINLIIKLFTSKKEIDLIFDIQIYSNVAARINIYTTKIIYMELLRIFRSVKSVCPEAFDRKRRKTAFLSNFPFIFFFANVSKGRSRISNNFYSSSFLLT